MSSSAATESKRFRKATSLAVSVLVAISLGWVGTSPAAADPGEDQFIAPAFSGPAAGAPDGWSPMWNAGDWSTVGTDPTVLRHEVPTGATGPRRAMTWDGVGDGGVLEGDVEVHAVMRVPETLGAATRLALGLHMSGAAGSETGYYLDVNANSLRFSRYLNGSQSQINGDANNTYSLGTFAAGTWYNFVLHRDGNSLAAKAWPYGEPEPEGWQIHRSETPTVIDSGKVGVFNNAANSSLETAFLSVGVDGAEAPRAPIGLLPGAQYTAPEFDGPAAGAPTGWTSLWNAGDWATTEIDERMVLGQETPADAEGLFRAMTYDEVGTVEGDVEVHAVMRVPGELGPETPRMAVALHMSGDVGAENAYMLEVHNGALRMSRINEGSRLSINSQPAPATYTIPGGFQGDTWYNLVLRRQDNDLMGKIWLYGAAEPAGWNVQRVDTPSVHHSGKVGVFAEVAGAKQQTAFFSVGTGGISAPRAPIDLFTVDYDPLLTGFENRGGASWTTHAEEQAFLQAVEEASDGRVRVTQIGTSQQGRPINLVRIGYPTAPSDEDIAAGRSIMLIATQHGNEPAGQEMALQRIRDLAFTEDPTLIEQLSNTSVIVIPVANPDGRVANTRAVANGVDMNRNHMLLTVPESQVIAQVTHQFNPDIVIDAHEIPGSSTGNVWSLWARNLNIDTTVRTMSYDLVNNYVFPDLQAAGLSYAIYGGAGASTTGNENEGIARNQFGLRGHVSVLFETAGGRPNLERVYQQGKAVDAVFRYQRENAAAIEAATNAAPGNRQAAGAAQEPFYLRGADNDPPTGPNTLNPAPLGYLLTHAQVNAAMQTRIDLQGIETCVTDDDKVFVTMNQPMMTVIPLMLHSGAPNVQAVGTPVMDEVPCGVTDAVTNLTAPSITGTPEVGETLTATDGTWDPDDVDLAYQWLRNGTPIGGASSSTYVVAVADAGTTLAVKVTASKTGYTSAVATSTGVEVASDDSNQFIAPEFSGPAAGAPEGWSPFWKPGDWSTVGGNPVVLRQVIDPEATTNLRRAMTWDEVGTAGVITGDVEVHAVMRVPGEVSSTTRFGMGLHLTENGTNEVGYYVDINGRSLRIGRLSTTGTWVQLGSSYVLPGFEGAAWYNLVLRREGNFLHAKAWAYGDAEPAEWQVTSPSNSLFHSGRVGVLANAAGARMETAYFSVGTGGATAPRAPLGLIDSPAGWDPLKTGFENRDGDGWTTRLEGLAFLDAVDAASDRVRMDQVGTTQNGLPIHLVRIGYPTAPSDEDIAEGRSVLIIGSQHGNEPAGREMSLQKIRDLAFTEDPTLIDQMSDTTILVIPSMNPDGSLANVRTVANGIDMNRDHLDLFTPEAQTTARVFQDFRPDIVIDAHEKPTTLGGADIDALWSRNLNTDPTVRAFSESLVRDYIFADFAAADRTYAVYGGEGAGGAGDARPDIARNMFGLRGSVSVLIETAGLRPGTERLVYQHAAVDSLLRFQRENAQAIEDATNAAPANRQAAGENRDPFYLDGADNDPPALADILDPGPCAYVLTTAQAEGWATQLDLHGIVTTPGPNEGEVLITMGQPSMAVVGLAFDPAAPSKVINGVRMSSAVDCAENPVLNVTPPSITGTPYVGQTLTADPGAWDPEDVTLEYQWLLDGVPIPGADGATFVPELAHITQTLSVRVTASAPDRDPNALTSAETAPVSVDGTGIGADQFIAPEFSGPAAGAPDDWSPLWGSGNWNTVDEVRTVLDHRTPSDASTELRRAMTWDELGTLNGDVEVHAVMRVPESLTSTVRLALGLHVSGVAGSETAYFLDVTTSSLRLNRFASGARSGIISDINSAVNYPLPGGFAADTWYNLVLRRDGDSLAGKLWAYGTAEPGAWQVYRAVAPTVIDSGRVGVFNEAAGGNSQTAFFSVGIGGADAPRAPEGLFDMPAVANVTAPSITGTPAVGQTLTAVPGTWDPSDVDLAYQWLRDDAVIDGATGSTYEVQAADVDAQLKVRVTGSKTGYTSQDATSSGVAVLPGAITAGSVSITGTPAVGQTLTAVPGTWDPSDVDLAYQWLRDDAPIDGATSATYAVQPADAGTSLKVRVTGSKTGYASQDATSAAVAVPAAPGTTFIDVPPTHQFNTEIQWLADAGISTGWDTPAGAQFRPSLAVSRDAMAAFLYRFAGEPEFTPPATSPFKDVPTSHQFYKHVSWLADEGISTGWTVSGGQEFRPSVSVSRDAMAAFMYRFAGEPEFTPPATSPFKDVKTNHQFYKQITWLASTGISTGWTVSGGSEFRPSVSVSRDAMAAFLYRLNNHLND